MQTLYYEGSFVLFASSSVIYISRPIVIISIDDSDKNSFVVESIILVADHSNQMKIIDSDILKYPKAHFDVETIKDIALELSKSRFIDYATENKKFNTDFVVSFELNFKSISDSILFVLEWNSPGSLVNLWNRTTSKTLKDRIDLYQIIKKN